MREITVDLPGRAYPITIGAGALGAVGATVAGLAPGTTACVVSDATVWGLHGKAFEAAMQAAGQAFVPIVVPAGEESKSLAMLERLYEGFAAAGLGRSGVVVAFGGGVTGDLAGFAAATWMRGVRYVQVPTTLLAQVDSSVGGKTAIDLPMGKNLAGAFHQPAAVLADTALLSTLPARQFRSGMAEVVKYGAILSAPLFEEVAAPPAENALPAIIEQCCRLKAGVVLADEHDTGRRMLLNFGHTFGHAIETLGGFAAYNHGEAVAVGMMLAAAVGEKLGFTKAGCTARLQAVLQAQGLPTTCPYPATALVEAMALDKKGRAEGVDLVLLRDIGTAETSFQPFSEIEKMLTEVL